jgi:hypothetical protein
MPPVTHSRLAHPLTPQPVVSWRMKRAMLARIASRWAALRAAAAPAEPAEPAAATAAGADDAELALVVWGTSRMALSSGAVSSASVRRRLGGEWLLASAATDAPSVDDEDGAVAEAPAGDVDAAPAVDEEVEDDEPELMARVSGRAGRGRKE